jgi:nitrite reductase/ring-hydroxylating ferredoxin subunit
LSEDRAIKVSRKRFLHLGAALGAAGTSVLAACGDGSGSSGSGSGGSGGSGSDGNGYGGGSGGDDKKTTRTESAGHEKHEKKEQASGGTAIAAESEVAPGSAVEFEDSGNPAVLVHLQSGDFVAYSAVCTHQACAVVYRGGNLACPCHGSVFDPSNGASVVNGPAQRPLPEIPVEVRNGEVFKA